MPTSPSPPPALRSDHYAYPDSLDARKYLHYRREAAGYTLYSIGENLTDDGGTPGRAAKGDIVITSPRWKSDPFSSTSTRFTISAVTRTGTLPCEQPTFWPCSLS